jgi:hypothetical protein
MLCIAVSSSSHWRYRLRMLQSTMHSLVMGAAVTPEPLTQVRAMRSRRVTTPQALLAATKAIGRSAYGPNPNGAKLYTAGTPRCRFKRPRNELTAASRNFLSETVEPQHRHNHVSARNFGSLIQQQASDLAARSPGFGRDDIERLRRFENFALHCQPGVRHALVDST